MNGPCSACGDGDTAMKYHSHATDPLTTAANTAWLEYAKGTWSETDRRVFVEGFRQGWRARLHHVTAISKADAEEYLRRVNGVK